MIKQFPWPTVGGYDFYEVLSALQKTIRRGLEKEALFWSTELYLSEYASHAWHRFFVIASEDVGPADPNTCVQIRALHTAWRERKTTDEAKLFFVHAVMTLVRASKSRIVDNALIVFFEGPREKLAIPDYALDKHTTLGRSKNRGNKHFFEEGAKLENITLPDVYEKHAKDIRK